MTMDIIVKKEEKTLEKNGGMASVPFYVKKIFFGLTSKVVQFSEKNEDKIAVMRQTVSVTVLFYLRTFKLHFRIFCICESRLRD